MKLYYMPGACSLATHITLQWLGKPFETQRMSREAIKQPDFLALNPLGAVPTVTDGDWVLTQNVAILEYLAESDPSAHLLGPDEPRARAETRRWLGFINADIHKTFGLIFGAQSWLPDEAGQQALQAAATKKLVALFKVVNDRLNGREYLVGDTPTVADAYLFVVLRWAKNKAVPLEGMPALAAFSERMSANPGVQAALAAEA